MGSLDGRVALVTGGGSGIGRAVVGRFVEEGARVGILERSQERVQQVQADLSDAVVAVQGDVTRLDDNERAVEQTVRAFGQLDIFVGNAGVFDGSAMLADLPKESLSNAFDEIFSVNVKGYLLGAKSAFPELLKTKGTMVFTASPAGLFPVGGGLLYVTSKHAVVGMIRRLAYELAPEVRVNGVAPGGTLTDLRSLAALGMSDRSIARSAGAALKDAPPPPNTPPRWLDPQDHTGAYLFLASRENSGSVTGIVIPTPGTWGERKLFQPMGSSQR
jgi:NAD(P)-dependent dehydrogenase (short-subunit alcohol dehydrogenase family)